MFVLIFLVGLFQVNGKSKVCPKPSLHLTPTTFSSFPHKMRCFSTLIIFILSQRGGCDGVGTIGTAEARKEGVPLLCLRVRGQRGLK